MWIPLLLSNPLIQSTIRQMLTLYLLFLSTTTLSNLLSSILKRHQEPYQNSLNQMFLSKNKNQNLTLNNFVNFMVMKSQQIMNSIFIPKVTFYKIMKSHQVSEQECLIGWSKLLNLTSLSTKLTSPVQNLWTDILLN